MEAQLPGVFELGFAFNRWTLGDEILLEQLTFAEEQIECTRFRPADGPWLHPRADRRGQ